MTFIQYPIQLSISKINFKTYFMGALKIDCYCNEKQMEKIVNMVVDHLNSSDRTEISDFDDVIDELRVCVEFDTYMDKVCIKTSEVLDNDWDLLDEDTAVLASRLKSVLKDYNRNRQEALCQAHHVLNDQRIIR